MAQDQFEVKELSLLDTSTGQVEEVHFVALVSDPTVGAGRPAPIGTLGLRTNGIAHQKTGLADTDWTAGASIGAPGAGGGISEAQHDALDQLVHPIKETHYEEPTYSGNKVTELTQWVDNTKTTRIRSEVLTYTGNNVTGVVITQYDAAGVAITGQILTGALTYQGNQLQNIEWVRT
jgi:hypothetical protein